MWILDEEEWKSSEYLRLIDPQDVYADLWEAV